MYDAMRVERVSKQIGYDNGRKLLRVLIEGTNYGVEATFEVYHPKTASSKVVGFVLLSVVRPDTNEAVELDPEWKEMALDAMFEHIASELEWGDYADL